ncbi:MAG TPA: ferredoxin [Dongiaceae bacterium]|nr:ferredoxin [Dongiaceae bacterium]
MGQFKRHVFVCTSGEYCPFEGSAAIHQFLKEGVQARGLKSTTRVNKSGCLDQCGHGPMVVVYPEDVWYGAVSPEAARRILDEHLAGGAPVEELRYRAAKPGANKNPQRMAAIDKLKAGSDPAAP